MEPQKQEIGPRKALGRGLSALMPGNAQAKSNDVANKSALVNSGLRLLPIELVHPNRTQPRKHFDEVALAELSESIKTQGVLQPIVVRRQGEGYEIVAGERRWRASTKAGLQEIPALVKELTDAAALEVALIENIQRQDLDPLEEAEAYGRLIRDHGLTHDQVAVAVGKSRSTVTNSIRLLRLPIDVLEMLADGRLTPGHARALMMIKEDDLATISRLAKDFSERRASVRDAEAHIKNLLKPSKKNKKAGKSGQAEVSVEERLQQALGCKIKLHQRQGKGRIELFFYSLDELDALMDRLIH